MNTAASRSAQTMASVKVLKQTENTQTSRVVS